jgi:hypothetical protein
VLEGVIGPVLISATAILAAVIAARTANERQAAQLAHDRELQKAQLAYDREQRNRQHVRDTIDSAVRSMDAAIRQAAEYQALILTGDEARAESRRIVDDESVPSADREAAIRRYQEAMHQITTSTKRGFVVSTELMSESLRLSLRLGVEHPICKSHTEYHTAYGTCFEILHNLPTVKLSEDDRERIKAADESERDAMIGFLSSCRRWFEDESVMSSSRDQSDQLVLERFAAQPHAPAPPHRNRSSV